MTVVVVVGFVVVVRQQQNVVIIQKLSLLLRLLHDCTVVSDVVQNYYSNDLLLMIGKVSVVFAVYEDPQKLKNVVFF